MLARAVFSHKDGILPFRPIEIRFWLAPRLVKPLSSLGASICLR